MTPTADSISEEESMPTPKDREELRRLAEAATPGPWRAANGKGSAVVVTDDPQHNCAIYLNVRTCEHDETVERWQADARLIAACSPSTITALLDQLDEVTRANETLRDFAQYMADRGCEYDDNCPSDARHYVCAPCRATRALNERKAGT